MDSGERIVMNYTKDSLRSKTAEFKVALASKASASKTMLEQDIEGVVVEAKKPYDKAVADAEKIYPTKNGAKDSGDTKHVLNSVQIANNQFKLMQAEDKARAEFQSKLEFSMELNGAGFPEAEDKAEDKAEAEAIFAQPLDLVKNEGEMTLNKMTLKNAGMDFFRFAAAAFSGKLKAKEAVVELADSKQFSDLDFIKVFAASASSLALNLQKLDDRGMAFVAELKKVENLPRMMIANAKMAISDLISGLVFERAELVVPAAEALALSEDQKAESAAAFKNRSFKEAVSDILGAEVVFKDGLSMSIENHEDASSDASSFVKSEVLSPDSKVFDASFVGVDFSGGVSAVSALSSDDDFRVGDYARPDESSLRENFDIAEDLAGDDFGLDAGQIAKLKEAVILETGLVSKEEVLRLLIELDDYRNSGSDARCTIS